MIVSICLLVFFCCGLNFAQPEDELSVSKTEFDALKEKLEILETKLRDTEMRQINCVSQIAELKNEASEKVALKEKLEILETKLRDTEMRQINSVSQIAELKNEASEKAALKEKLEILETKLRDTEMRQNNSVSQIAELKNQASKKVIFSAALGGSGSIGPFWRDSTLIYREVKTNIGNAYSSSTGVFTAPVAGVYGFTIFHHAGNAHKTVLSLYKNYREIIRTQNHQAVHEVAQNGGNAVFLQLQRGDRVYVEMNGDSYIWGGDYHSTFSGFLVSHV